jgi:phospholipase/carboxylesterase
VSLIENEMKRGITCERIVLAGFSQGGAIALHTALRYPKKLGAVLALSTYLPLHSSMHAEINAANASTPIFMAHGIFDDIISLDMAKVSRDLLTQHDYPVHWHEYNMAHSVSNEEIADIEKFLHQVLD